MLGFSKQAFYKWQANPVTDRVWADAHLINTALDIHADDPAFGYRFIADQLAERGITASENRVQRLCQQEQIWSVFAKKRGLSRRVGPPVHDDLVDRDFTAPTANRVWLTDITEHPTAEGKLYLCAIKDVWSTRIVGYSMSSRMTAALAVSALSNAVALRDPAGTTVHSDRGSQFRSNAFVIALKNHGLVGSMGRVGACGDNAAMESFFSLLQKNPRPRVPLLTTEHMVRGSSPLEHANETPAQRPLPEGPLAFPGSGIGGDGEVASQPLPSSDPMTVCEWCVTRRGPSRVPSVER